MPNNLIRQPNFGALMVLVWLVVALALLQYWGQTAESLLDTDDGGGRQRGPRSGAGGLAKARRRRDALR
jgi:hypothetical protein